MHEYSKPQCYVWRALRLAGVPISNPGALEVVRSLNWAIEQQPMILKRFPVSQNDAHTIEGLDYWKDKFDRYLSRAELLTLESPEGRQAIAEHFAASLGLLASVWRIYGPPSSNAVGYHQDTTVVKVE
ncbi:MAG TPA: hypothetical protein PJ993_01360 [Candidatus Saccharibacteria bacterium]|nr:hypothetical protein [Candidatus Saccharibacteria bacterium]HMT39567.1 hypothetical protein [Candidatus Saccharibacteria bacterium]